MLKLNTDPKKARLAGFLSSFICLISFALALGFLLIDCSSVSASPLPLAGIHPIPAYARKYSMPCSACHDSWPRLSPFGQAFKDNGYQLMNDRDAPIYQNPSYWPISFRITPEWHRISTNRVPVDGSNPEAQITQHGFDWSGLDILAEGTLAKNISFIVLPSADSTGAFHMEAVFVRFDNLLKSPWLNVKVGKFELDNLQSEKRILTLSDVGGAYQNYHFQPLVTPGSSENGFAAESLYADGIGDNQVGAEWMGHSKNDRTRLSAAVLSSNDGQPGLVTGKSYNGFFAGSQAFQVGNLGLQRVGGFAYIGQAPTFFQFNSGGAPIPGTGIGNKPFYRAGFNGFFFIKKFDVTAMYFYGKDSAYLSTNTAATDPLPTGAQSATWNGALVEPHYTVNSRLVFTGRYEAIRMSQQAIATNPSDFGNIDAGTIGFRFYPFMSSRAGFAFHNEYSIMRQRKAAPVTANDLTSSSVMIGFDFAF